MADKTWKRRERQVAAALGGRRIPITGLDRHGADVTTARLAVQVKRGRRRPGYLSDWLDGIRARGAETARTGIVVWCDHQEDIQEAIVLLRLRDFIELREGAR
jgi:hypothetical protein